MDTYVCGTTDGGTMVPLECQTFFLIDEAKGGLEGISLKLFDQVE